MKKAFLILTLSFTIQLSYAECAFSGFKFYPEKREISQNSIFIIEGYSYSQKVINSFSKNRQAYLESEDGTIVDLLLEEVLIGQMDGSL
ncbi:hypothetical protein R9C00_27910 [Flammeovirgaceae bacterium SG7u.111]|nr:hypothetical protein [Flammeovirgaceae bacterium SG7u.132]WPO35526.1 hypothetical protein R9C00_27910 [Flammeovirgaceae bacterium SG7u.111]